MLRESYFADAIKNKHKTLGFHSKNRAKGSGGKMSYAVRWTVLSMSVFALMTNVWLALWQSMDVIWAVICAIIGTPTALAVAYLDFLEWERDRKEDDARTALDREIDE